MEVKKTPILKEVYTNNLYQSTFMPVFQRAETRIKTLILAAFFISQPKYLLRLAIAKVIADVGAKIPESLQDKEVYMNSLVKKSEQWIRTYYDLQLETFKKTKESLLATIPYNVKVPMIKSPQELVRFTKSDKMWAAAKGTPNVVNYSKEVNLRLNQLANDPLTTQEPGKRPISLWQKAELDVRYEHQMQELQNDRLKGVKLAWISSHPNCSHRCSKWQGELVALEGHAPNPQTVVNHKTFNYNKRSFAMGKVDGHTVYSLTDIMAVVDDKYGYHNNVISGFNCRHRLIPYNGQLPPEEYTAEEIKQQREIEAHIRDMERNIRLHKTRLEMYNKINETKIAKQIKERIDVLVARYKSYCEKNGYAWHKFRIEV